MRFEIRMFVAIVILIECLLMQAVILSYASQ